jgi:hypothetical protein
MKKPTVRYSKGEIGGVRIVEDFLPPPEKLVVLTDEQMQEALRRRGDQYARKLMLKDRMRRRDD